MQIGGCSWRRRLLLATVGVSGVMTTSLRAQSGEAAQRQLEQRVQAELARLRALPYSLSAPAPGSGGADPAGARSLLEAVFPHALAAHNTPSAFAVQAGPGRPWTFTTARAASWGVLSVECHFVTAVGGTWEPVAAEFVEGWAIWRDAVPPSPGVRITVGAASTGPRPHRAETTVVVAALRPSVMEPAP
jgi:hypothetical protein